MTNKIVAVSGGFDPIHEGHIRLFCAASKLGFLLVILNNDNWLMKKKGYVFMPLDGRRVIVGACRYVDSTVVSEHPPYSNDMSICGALSKWKPNIFANGGDRIDGDPDEIALCNELGIELVYNVGGFKYESSSRLVEKFRGI